MSKTISGHPAATSYNDPMLASGIVPGTKISLKTAKPALPLFLHVAAALNREVLQLNPKDTWSIAIRPPRAGAGISDHAGWAIDCWSGGIGAQTWPSRMSDNQAFKMARVLERYRTKDGRHIFGWGAVKAGGYTGRHYTQTRYNDPMHVFIAPGITPEDLRETRKRMGIKKDGTSVSPVKPTKPTPTQPPAPKPEKPAGSQEPTVIVPSITHTAVQPGDENMSVLLVQKALAKTVGLDYSNGPGIFGPATKTAYRAWQRSLGYTGADADGVPGPQSLRELGKRTGVFTVYP